MTKSTELTAEQVETRIGEALKVLELQLDIAKKQGFRVVIAAQGPRGAASFGTGYQLKIKEVTHVGSE